jgi:hypothetical protein
VCQSVDAVAAVDVVAAHGLGLVVVRELRLITTLTHFGTATDVTIAELRLEAFLPADESTSAALIELVTW